MIDDNFMLKKHSILKPLGVFIFATLCIFVVIIFFILKPRVEALFDDAFRIIESNMAKSYASQLELYLHDRELALRDIAQKSIVLNAMTMTGYESSELKEYIDELNILGEDVNFALLNTLGAMIYKEDEFVYREANQYSHLKLLEANVSGKSIIIHSSNIPMFELAVPIVYSENIKGIFIAQFSIPYNQYDQLMPELFVSENVVVTTISDGYSTVHYNNHMNSKEISKVNVEHYGLTLSVMGGHSLYKAYIREILLKFSYSIVFGSMLMLAVLYFIGKKLIVYPFRVLQKSKTIIESTIGGIALLDTDLNFLTLNDAFSKSLKYETSYFFDKDITFFIHSDEQSQLNTVISDITNVNNKAKHKASMHEIKCMAGDGGIVFLQLTLLAQYNKNSECSGYIVFSQDITKQKEYEIQLLSQQQELKLIFDYVPLSIWYKDDKNKIIRLNKAAAQSMGGNVKDFEGRNTYDLLPERAKKYHDDDLAVINSNTPKLNVVEEYILPNGEHKWIKTDKIPYRNPVTSERYIFVCSQDMTLIKAAEEEKTKLIAALSEKNNDLEQFSFIASHDLKAPLRGIEQTASWVLEDCEEYLPSQSKEHLAMMMRRVKRMGRLLDDLLEYSRTEKIDNTLEWINIPTLMDELIDLHLLPFGFTCNLLGLPDKNLLLPKIPFEIVIRNLLSNAVKHHHKGVGRIEIAYERREDKNIFIITDDGPGIDYSMHEKAFQMFQTLKPRDITEGSGMGLAIVKRLLMRDGGSVRIISDGVSGCTFEVEWPIFKGEASHE